jgi:hypothetical protein
MARMPAMPEPGPSPVLGSFDQVCPQRVSLDVAADRRKMLVGIDRKRFESSLVERLRAERSMRMVPSRRVRKDGRSTDGAVEHVANRAAYVQASEIRSRPRFPPISRDIYVAISTTSGNE